MGNKKNVLILGGTGYVGKYILNAFLEYGHNVSVFNRGNQRSFTKKHSITNFIGCRMKNDFGQLKGRKWDVIIDVPYFKPKIVKSALDYLYDNTSLYVFISSMSVHDLGKNPNTPYDEYCSDKVIAEGLFDGKENSLILRPGILVGDGDNTNRFIHSNTGDMLWKHNGKIVTEPYTKVEDFALEVVELVEQNEKGIYDY
jgi:2'-hydroxyisoflavone reductase